jgi:hypothetical protein
MLHEKVQRRSKDELLEYSEILNSRELFSQAKLKDLPGLCHFVGEGKQIKQVVVDWMIKYTVDEATALHVCAYARSVAHTLYDSIKVYKQEAKIVTSGEWFYTYLWMLLKNTRYSVLHTMLIEANQLQHLEKEKEKKGTGRVPKEVKKPILPRTHPYYHLLSNGTIISIFDDPLNTEPEQVGDTTTKPEKKKRVWKQKKNNNELSNSADQSGPGMPHGLLIEHNQNDEASFEELLQAAMTKTANHLGSINNPTKQANAERHEEESMLAAEKNCQEKVANDAEAEKPLEEEAKRREEEEMAAAQKKERQEEEAKRREEEEKAVAEKKRQEEEAKREEEEEKAAAAKKRQEEEAKREEEEEKAAAAKKTSRRGGESSKRGSKGGC